MSVYLDISQFPLRTTFLGILVVTPIVLDPFAGSATTALACLSTGRSYLCIEKDKGYYEIAKERIANV